MNIETRIKRCEKLERNNFVNAWKKFFQTIVLLGVANVSIFIPVPVEYSELIFAGIVTGAVVSGVKFFKAASNAMKYSEKLEKLEERMLRRKGRNSSLVNSRDRSNARNRIISTRTNSKEDVNVSYNYRSMSNSNINNNSRDTSNSYRYTGSTRRTLSDEINTLPDEINYETNFSGRSRSRVK